MSVAKSAAVDIADNAILSLVNALSDPDQAANSLRALIYLLPLSDSPHLDSTPLLKIFWSDRSSLEMKLNVILCLLHFVMKKEDEKEVIVAFSCGKSEKYSWIEEIWGRDDAKMTFCQGLLVVLKDEMLLEENYKHSLIYHIFSVFEESERR